ncbi:hypothetical protein LINPERHAP1_LOCUS19158, partial [Linum perenne]
PFPGLRTNRRHCRLQAPFRRHFLVLNNRRQNPLAVSKLTVGVPRFILGGPSFMMTNEIKKTWGIEEEKSIKNHDLLVGRIQSVKSHGSKQRSRVKNQNSRRYWKRD